MAVVLETIGLTRYFGQVVAADGISLRIEAGERVGIVGPNGAGKTTTIRILASLVAPDGGRARVAGFDVAEDPAAVHSAIGHMPELFGLYDELTV
ncbi:MAG: ATP-binding cassette domain-containing protein, partial [candidate division NC10 bacterium]|nr:ATP-binding cassette domain-containing protein [candidate division NC10 bacterium]